MIGDVSTRWNSTASMIKWALLLQEAFKLLVVMEQHNCVQGAWPLQVIERWVGTSCAVVPYSWCLSFTYTVSNFISADYSFVGIFECHCMDLVTLYTTSSPCDTCVWYYYLEAWWVCGWQEFAPMCLSCSSSWTGNAKQILRNFRWFYNVLNHNAQVLSLPLFLLWC